jgi:serine/threonine protein kinase
VGATSTTAASHTESRLAPGYKLDRYELLCAIAEGGMASVWIARQRGKHGFEKLVALKTILPKFASDMRFQQMFLDEARIASRIEHPNVAQIFDLGEEHEVLYLAMEYVDGDAFSKLRRACQKKGVFIPPGIALRVFSDACGGLHEAHELRADGKSLEIVHRDISPHNVLVSTKGVVKLIDFGVAKARDRMAGETAVGVLKGKIQYMAPEQALGRRVDRRADVWAVGASLYHVLVGKAPFEADNTVETLHILASGRPPAPMPDTVHPSVAAIVQRALTHDPERRFATAAEMRDAMESALLDMRARTTTGDVAAFVTEYFAERMAQRHKAIEIALVAAVERKRVEEVLKPTKERGTFATSASGLGASQSEPGVESITLGPDDAKTTVSPASSPKLPAVPPPPPTLRMLPPPPKTPRVPLMQSAPHAALSQPAAGVYVAPSDASLPELPPVRSRAPLLVVVGVVGLAIAIGAIALVVAAKRVPHGRAAASATTRQSPVAVAPPVISATSGGAQPVAASTSSGEGTGAIPVVSLSALPKANDSPAPTGPVATTTVIAAGTGTGTTAAIAGTASAKPTASQAAPKKPRPIDDGF